MSTFNGDGQAGEGQPDYNSGEFIGSDQDWADVEPDAGYAPEPAQQQQQDERRLAAEAELLVRDIPELEDDATVQRVATMVGQYAQSIGRPDLIHEPEFWRMAIEANGGVAEERQRTFAEEIAFPGGHLGSRALPFG